MSLQLPKTKLMVRDETLTKTGKNDEVLAEFQLTDITNVRVEKTVEYSFPAVIISVLVSLAVVCKLYVPIAGLAWAGTIVCLGIAGLIMLSVHGRKFVIETQNGVVGYPVTDTFEDADGFVLSLRQKLQFAETDERPQVN
jgi:hypothetical protein